MSTISKAPLLLQVVSAAVSVSRKAQMLVRAVLKGGHLDVVEKGVNDMQTKADRLSQMTIVGSLRRQFPNISVHGEEDLSQSTMDGVDASLIESSFDQEVLSTPCPSNISDITADRIVVWVDPLDGTNEFLQGLLDHVTILIGIAVDGVATAGVIAQPYYQHWTRSDTETGRVMWAIAGIGVFGMNVTKPPKGGNIIATTRSHWDALVDSAIKACEPTELVRVGGCGHKVLLVLEGKAHAYVFASRGCKKWDTCAPEAFMRACHGQLTDLHGKPYRYTDDVPHQNSGGVLATLENHAWYVERFPRQVLDSLPTQHVVS